MLSPSVLGAILQRRLIALLAIASLAGSCVAASASPGALDKPSQPIATSSLGSATATRSPEARVVPWVDRPAPAYVEPTPMPYPADARPCRPADLAVKVGDVGAALGNTNLPVRFVNQSSSACVLNGYPTIGGLTSAGKLVPLEVSEGSYFGDPGPTANVGPEGITALNISGADACPAALGGAHKIYPTLRIGLPAGGTIDVPGGGFDAICGVSVSRFGVPADSVPGPAPSPSPLSARISAPSTAAPGQLLEFTVTLTNPTTADLPLDPCPAYTEYVGSGDASPWVATVRDYYLNCDTASKIPAGGSLTFEMRLQLPANQPAGQAKFGWDLQGGAGPWANAALEVQRIGG